MILCSIHDVPPDAILGSTVSDPLHPESDLLRAGVPLDTSLLASLKKRGVVQLWIQDDLAADLDAAITPRLTAAKLQTYSRIRDGLAECAHSTITSGSIQNYRAAALEMVAEAISSAKYASMTDSLFGESAQASHATNVAYLSLVCGLSIQRYVMDEQPRLAPEQRREFSILGLAGMLHDIGKTRLPAAAARFHDAHALESEGTLPRPSQYLDHAAIGKSLLENSRAPARVAHAVLNHHQRFDGYGWPDMTAHTSGRITGPLAGKRIHIFARIVAAANVLDNLLRDAHGAMRPPVAALREFASPRFDGWFDPIVRRAMLLRVPPFAIGTDIRLSDGRRAVVVSPNAEDPCRPAVRIIAAQPSAADAPGPPNPATLQNIDLQSTPSLSITHALGADVSQFLYSVPAHTSTAEEFSPARAAAA